MTACVKAPPEKRQKKETLLSAELGKYLDKKVRVKFQGGREGKRDSVTYAKRVPMGADPEGEISGMISKEAL